MQSISAATSGDDDADADEHVTTRVATFDHTEKKKRPYKRVAAPTDLVRRNVPPTAHGPGRLPPHTHTRALVLKRAARLNQRTAAAAVRPKLRRRHPAGSQWRYLWILRLRCGGKRLQ